MDYTQHYNLKKPAYGEAVDVKDLNDNADITDAQLNTLAGLVAARLLKTDLTNQIINDATKVASAATVYSVNKKADDLNSDLNEGKYFRAYTSAFVFGRSIAANSKDNAFDFNISARGFSSKPSVFIFFPAIAKLTNIRYDYDNSTHQIAKIIFDNEGAAIAADTYIRVGVIAIV
jgi:hypothetical protein